MTQTIYSLAIATDDDTGPACENVDADLATAAVDVDA